LLASIILLTACAGQQQSAQPLATAPPAQTIVATVAPSPSAIPSLTPAPTSTPLPTAVPTPTIAPTSAATPTSQPASLAGQALVAELRQGGYVIFFRHAATDMTQADSDLSRCETQRNLNAQGRADARAIGMAFQSLGIPVGQVLSSGYCRAHDTAQLAFGRSELARDLSGLPAAQREQRTAALRKLLATEPEAGRNSVTRLQYHCCCGDLNRRG
jgi:hypothetical protein